MLLFPPTECGLRFSGIGNIFGYKGYLFLGSENACFLNNKKNFDARYTRACNPSGSRYK